MPRGIRLKIPDNTFGAYHLCTRVSSERNQYILEKGYCRQRLLEIIEKCGRNFFCNIYAYCIMGNHYHIVVDFEKYRKVDRVDLYRRALEFYPNSKYYIVGKMKIGIDLKKGYLMYQSL